MSPTIARKVLGTGVVIRGAMVAMGPLGIDRARLDWAETDRNPFFCPDPGAVPVPGLSPAAVALTALAAVALAGLGRRGAGRRRG